jgi:hypothetical protein
MKIESSFNSFGKSQLHCNNRFAVFGDKPNDDVVVYRPNVAFKKPALHIDGVNQSVPADALEHLMTQVQSLTVCDANAIFALNKSDFDFIKQICIKKDVTHIRFHTKNNMLRIVMVDLRMQDELLRIQRKRSQQVFVIDLEIRIVKDFSFTAKASSLKKLPSQDYSVRIGSNGISVFTSITEESHYLIRDQRISEPLISFFSPRLDSDILFSPVPNF